MRKMFPFDDVIVDIIYSDRDEPCWMIKMLGVCSTRRVLIFDVEIAEIIYDS